MTSRRRLLAALAVAALAALLAAGAVVLSTGDGEGDGIAAGTGSAAASEPRSGGLDRCFGLADEARAACYGEELAALVRSAGDADVALEEIAAEAYGRPESGLLADCHGLVHTVGREYARERAVTLGTLMTYLPQTNEPGCSAGFAHGLVTGVAPQVDLRRPRAAASVCDETETRYQRYSCVHGFGHAFMRLVREELTEGLRLCTALGADVAPDCAQGGYQVCRFAGSGADDTERPATVLDDPRELCAGQPERFVRPCWYRAYVDDRPEQPVDDAADIEALCAGLAGLQREACVTAAVVVGPPDPRGQLGICTALRGADAVACIRGTKVQNLLAAPPEDLVALVRQCDGFPDETRLACYRWLAKVLAVTTDGRFERFGCPAAPDAASRRACRAGVRASEGPLETFS